MDSKVSGLLQSSRIFEGLPPDKIAEVLPCVVTGEKTFGEGECVYEKGARVRELGVVVGGGLRAAGAVGDADEGGEILSGGMFGELVVFSTGGVLRRKVVATEDGTRVLFLSPDFFSRACGKEKDCLAAHGEVMANMLRLLSDKAILLGKKVAYLTAPDLKTKIAMYLLELFEAVGSRTFTMPLNRDQLAAFFSVARPSLSRELVHMKEAGLIDFRRSTVTVLDVDGLSRLAGR